MDNFLKYSIITILREQYRRAGKEIPEEARGIKIFENGVKYFE